LGGRSNAQQLESHALYSLFRAATLHGLTPLPVWSFLLMLKHVINAINAINSSMNCEGETTS